MTLIPDRHFAATSSPSSQFLQPVATSVAYGRESNSNNGSSKRLTAATASDAQQEVQRFLSHGAVSRCGYSQSNFCNNSTCVQQHDALSEDPVEQLSRLITFPSGMQHSCTSSVGASPKQECDCQRSEIPKSVNIHSTCCSMQPPFTTSVLAEHASELRQLNNWVDGLHNIDTLHIRQPLVGDTESVNGAGSSLSISHYSPSVKLTSGLSSMNSTQVAADSSYCCKEQRRFENFQRQQTSRSKTLPADFPDQVIKMLHQSCETVSLKKVLTASLQQPSPNSDRDGPSSPSGKEDDSSVRNGRHSQRFTLDYVDSSAWSSIASRLLSPPAHCPPLRDAFYNASDATTEAPHDSAETFGNGYCCNTPASAKLDAFDPSGTLSLASTVNNQSSRFPVWRSTTPSAQLNSPSYSAPSSNSETFGQLIDGLQEARKQRNSVFPSVSFAGRAQKCLPLFGEGAQQQDDALLKHSLPLRQTPPSSNLRTAHCLSSINPASLDGYPSLTSRPHNAFRFKEDTVLENQYLSGNDEDDGDETADLSLAPALINTARRFTLAQIPSNFRDASSPCERDGSFYEESRRVSKVVPSKDSRGAVVSTTLNTVQGDAPPSVAAMNANTTVTLKNLLLDALLNSNSSPITPNPAHGTGHKSRLFSQKEPSPGQSDVSACPGAAFVRRSRARTFPAVPSYMRSDLVRDLHQLVDSDASGQDSASQKHSSSHTQNDWAEVNKQQDFLSNGGPRRASTLNCPSFFNPTGRKNKLATPSLDALLSHHAEDNFRPLSLSKNNCIGSTVSGDSRLRKSFVCTEDVATTKGTTAPCCSNRTSVSSADMGRRSTQAAPQLAQLNTGRVVKFSDTEQAGNCFSKNADSRVLSRKSITLPPTSKANVWLADHLRLHSSDSVDKREVVILESSEHQEEAASNLLTCQRRSSGPSVSPLVGSPSSDAESTAAYQHLFFQAVLDGSNASATDVGAPGAKQSPTETQEVTSTNVGSLTAAQTQEKLHSLRRCKPCAFFYNKKKGCRNGSCCEFCHHEDHSKLALKQWKKQQQKIMKMERHGHATWSFPVA